MFIFDLFADNLRAKISRDKRVISDWANWNMGFSHWLILVLPLMGWFWEEGMGWNSPPQALILETLQNISFSSKSGQQLWDSKVAKKYQSVFKLFFRCYYCGGAWFLLCSIAVEGKQSPSLLFVSMVNLKTL